MKTKNNISNYMFFFLLFIYIMNILKKLLFICYNRIINIYYIRIYVDL